MTHDDHRALLALRALGSLDAADGGALEAHLDTCRACGAELAALSEAAASLALLAPPVAPPADALPRLLAALDDGGAHPRPGRRPLAIAAGLAVAAGVALLLAAQWRLRGRLDAASRELAALHEVGRFVASPDVSVVPLWGPAGAGDGAHAKIAYDHASGRFVFLAARMPPPPPGRGYRLWVISERISSAGAIPADGPVGTVAVRPRGDEPFLFAVSLEPSAGARPDEPSDALVLMSPPLRGPRR